MIFYDLSISPLKSPHLITHNSDNSVVEYYFQDHITSLRTGWDNIVEEDYQTTSLNLTFLWWWLADYCQTFDISHTKCQQLNVSHLVLQLSLPNPLKPGVK